jgi:hypothetical protein
MKRKLAIIIRRLPTTEEVNSLKRYCLTQRDNPWNTSSFSNQVADKFEYKHDYSSDIKVDLGYQEIPKLSYFNPSDTHSILIHQMKSCKHSISFRYCCHEEC